MKVILNFLPLLNHRGRGLGNVVATTDLPQNQFNSECYILQIYSKHKPLCVWGGGGLAVTGYTKVGSIIVPLTSCLTGLELAV